MTGENELPLADRVAIREMKEFLRRRRSADSPRARALISLEEDGRLKLLAAAREIFGTGVR